MQEIIELKRQVRSLIALIDGPCAAPSKLDAFKPYLEERLKVGVLEYSRSAARTAGGEYQSRRI